jgi:branched-chain amino acid transport system ATP-binding protein
VVGQLAREGMSVLLVEQFARTAMRVADYAAVMTNGRIMAVGQPQDIEQELSAAYLGGAA